MISNEYAAAFIDGEGSIMLFIEKRKENRLGVRYKSVVSVPNTCLTPLEAFREKYGGSIGISRKAGETHNSVTSTKDCYKWVCPSTAVKQLLLDIEPYLLIKKTQCHNALELIELNNRTVNYSVATDISDAKHSLYLYNRFLNNSVLTDKERDLVQDYLGKKIGSSTSIRFTSAVPMFQKPVLRDKVDTNSTTVCSVDGCGEKHYGKGLCRKHYRRKYESKYAHNPEEKRACKWCSKDISDLRPDKLVCSLSCKSKWHRANNKLKCTGV